MSEVKRLQRYSRDFNGNLSKDPNGDWILFGDAAEREGILTGKIGAQRLRADTAEAERDTVKAESKALAELDDVTIANLGSRLKAAEQRLEKFTGLIEEFCQRVEAGEVRSKATYAKFKAALNPNPEAESHGS